jgi:uncharacterized protein Yka (UPF0111/DUF47 family)
MTALTRLILHLESLQHRMLFCANELEAYLSGTTPQIDSWIEELRGAARQIDSWIEELRQQEAKP